MHGAIAQDLAPQWYIGLMPSVLVEPYDSVNAVEINVLPLVFEKWRHLKYGLQFRPMVNYRIYAPAPGISHLGGSVLLNRYFPLSSEKHSQLKPLIGFYTTFTHNRLDKVNTLTLGLEPGIKIGGKVSVNINLQPGINWYPDAASRAFVGAPTGFLPHFGLVFHVGYHLGYGE
ncbi:MAG: hypothetical protein HYZ16_08740 [Bacteroidetes bacterium]|nr:hypothetical protein [Bacteroidota bacterium]